MKYVSLFLNSSPLPINKYVVGDPIVANGIAKIYLKLPNEIFNSILDSNDIGIAIQYSYEAPVFLGFDRMEITDGKEKIKNIMDLCSR